MAKTAFQDDRARPPASPSDRPPAKIAVVIVLLLFLIRLKWDLGLVLFLDTVLTAVLFGMTPAAFRARRPRRWSRAETLELVGIVILVLYLGHFLQAGGHFREMVDALKNLVHDPRLILAIPSAFIGLLPMMAGAMMGAPDRRRGGQALEPHAGLEDVLQLLVPPHLGIQLAAVHQPDPGRGHLPGPDQDGSASSSSRSRSWPRRRASSSSSGMFPTFRTRQAPAGTSRTSSASSGASGRSS